MVDGVAHEEARSGSEGDEPRAMCWRCFKAAAVCICDSVRPVDNRTGVIVLQHPRERFHPMGTVRFLRLGLERAEVRVVAPRVPDTLPKPGELPPGAALLYPSPGARDVAELAPHERPRHLVVLDGTWAHAARLYDACAEVRALPHLRVCPSAPSRYRIRKEPRFECLSTLEAVVTTLRYLEPQTHGLDELLGSFDAMIDRQIDIRSSCNSPRRRRPSLAAGLPPIPRVLVERYPDLVVCYSEAIAVADRSPELPRHELVACVALRPDVNGPSRVFTALRRPRYVEPRPDQLAHMGLAPEDLDSALEPDAFDAAWADFVRARDVLLAWTQLSLDVLPFVPASMALKGVYRSVAGVPSGHLSDVVRRHALNPPPPVFPGRAGERLAESLAVIEHLRTIALQFLSPPSPTRSS